MAECGLQFTIGADGVIKNEGNKQDQDGKIQAETPESFQHFTVQQSEEEHENASPRNAKIDVPVSN